MVERQREHGTVNMTNGIPWEKVVLTTFGRDTTVFDNLMWEAQQMSETKSDGHTLIYTK